MSSERISFVHFVPNQTAHSSNLLCIIVEILIHTKSQDIIVNFTDMAFSSSDISLRMEHLFVTPLFYLLAGFWGLFSHICFFFWTCAHYIKSKHHLHIKINIWSTWYHVPSIWDGKRNIWVNDCHFLNITISSSCN